MCDSCTRVLGKVVSGTSRTFATKHITRDDHTRNISHQSQAEASILSKAAKRAAELQSESDIHNDLMQDYIPPQLRPPKRPRPLTYDSDADDFMTGSYEHLHGITFSAGHAELGAPKTSKAPFRVSIPLDKFGEPSDDFDVTSAAIGDEIQHAGPL